MSENKKTNQIQPPEELVLCGASAYNQKFYINENFKNLPDEIDHLHMDFFLSVLLLLVEALAKFPK